MFFTTKTKTQAIGENQNSFYQNKKNSRNGMLAPHAASRPQKTPKVLLIDDDLSYCKIIKKTADFSGVNLTYCKSVEEFSMLSQWEYDVIIMDYDLGYVTGCELTNYIENYVKDVTVVLVSQTERKESKTWPRSIERFVSKSRGPHAVIEAVFNAHKNKKALKRRSSSN